MLIPKPPLRKVVLAKVNANHLYPSSNMIGVTQVSSITSIFHKELENKLFERSKYFFEYQISMTTFLGGMLKKLNAEYILGQDFDILTTANTWPRQDPNTWREHGRKKRQN